MGNTHYYMQDAMRPEAARNGHTVAVSSFLGKCVQCLQLHLCLMHHTIEAWHDMKSSNMPLHSAHSESWVCL